MMFSETVFANSVPVGRILLDTDTKEVTFLPASSPSKLPAKDYTSIDEMRNAVIAAYQAKEGGEAIQ